MTTKQLIEKLSRYPDDTNVFVNGQEEGYDIAGNVTSPILLKALSEHKLEHWKGKYVSEFSEDFENNSNPVLNGVIIL